MVAAAVGIVVGIVVGQRTVARVVASGVQRDLRRSIPPHVEKDASHLREEKFSGPGLPFLQEKIATPNVMFMKCKNKFTYLDPNFLCISGTLLRGRSEDQTWMAH